MRLVLLFLAACGARTELGGTDLLDATAADAGDGGAMNICPLTPPTGGASCTPDLVPGSMSGSPACIYAPQMRGGMSAPMSFICTTGGTWGITTNNGGAHCTDLVCQSEENSECIENGTLCCRGCSAGNRFIDCGPC